MNMDQQYCYTCHSELKLVPAGVSKNTGKPYNAFWACPQKCTQKYPPKGEVSAPPVGRTPQPKQDVDWDKVSRGKVRHGLAVEAYKMGKKPDVATLADLEAWVAYIMGDEKLPVIQTQPDNTSPIDMTNIPF